jgi:hypothetical protein
MSLLSRLSGIGRKRGPQRRHARHSCMIVAAMTITDKGVTLDGLVNEISLGGVKFRPATTYLLDRAGDEVTISMDGVVIAGTIRATTSVGYGVQLAVELEEDDLRALSKYFKSPQEMAAMAAA